MSLKREQAIAIMDDLAKMKIESWVHSYPEGVHMGEKRQERFFYVDVVNRSEISMVHLKRLDELAVIRSCTLKLSVSDGSLHPTGKLVLQYL